jgi:hypothetical protein
MTRNLANLAKVSVVLVAMTARTTDVLKGALAVAVVVALGGCGSAYVAGAAAPSPPVVAGENTAGPDLSGVSLPDFVMPLLKGGVSRPNPSLTPGAITTTSTQAVCGIAQHSSTPTPSTQTQNSVFGAYGITSASAQRKYVLDYLVPYDLGGSTSADNLWPAALRGTGFYEKVETDVTLRDMVCRDEISLTAAQQALETNWYAAWLRYVVATGHI